MNGVGWSQIGFTFLDQRSDLIFPNALKNFLHFYTHKVLLFEYGSIRHKTGHHTYLATLTR